MPSFEKDPLYLGGFCKITRALSQLSVVMLRSKFQDVKARLVSHSQVSELPYAPLSQDSSFDLDREGLLRWY